MTNELIKKEWNKLKKELTKGNDPYGLKGCMYMMKKQLENRTATIMLANAFTYEEMIEYYKERIEALPNSNKLAEYEQGLAHYTSLLERFGTRANEAKWKVEEITSTKAWEAFAEAVGVDSLRTEEMQNCLYLRINY